MSVKDLLSVSLKEQKEFIDSVDQIISDVDGVIWLLGAPLEGSARCIEALKSLGKNIIYVTNNTLFHISDIQHKLEEGGFGKNAQIVNPTLAIIHYLKGINFNKEVFIVGNLCLKDELEKAGFKIADSGPSKNVEENIFKLFENFNDNENIGAVILDWDMNASFVKLQRAVTYLKRPDVLLIFGATDRRLPLSPNTTLIGPKYFQKAVEEVSGRTTSIVLAKPGVKLNDYILEVHSIKDPSKVLFIGDTIIEDMGFATNSGYKKLLVLSGVTKKHDITQWKHPEALKPNYYIESLGKLFEVIEKFK